MKTLTRDDIIEITGREDLENLYDLEILFNSFEDTGFLIHCPNLTRLCLLDNGMRILNSLTSLSMTLQILNISDQNIETFEPLNLPHLRELYLQRNNIKQLPSFNLTPKLKIIWLSDNKIESIAPLNNLLDLEELYIEKNLIKSINYNNINNLKKLKVLKLANNPILNFNSINSLIFLTSLISLSFYDIHYGASPITELNGYVEYFLLNFKSLKYLDGIIIKKEEILNAKNNYINDLTVFSNELREIDEQFQLDMRSIDSQYQSKESYSQVLEKEMTSALKELHNLVEDGRKIIIKEAKRTENLIETNFLTLNDSLNNLKSSTENMINENHNNLVSYYAELNELVSYMELIEKFHIKVINELSNISKSLYDEYLEQSTISTNNSNTLRRLGYQNIGSNAADYLYMSLYFSQENKNEKEVEKEIKKKKKILSKNYELVKLYKISILPNFFTFNPNHNLKNDNKNNFTRIFTLLTQEELFIVLRHGWNSLLYKGNSTKKSQIFSTNPLLLLHHYENISNNSSKSNLTDFFINKEKLSSEFNEIISYNLEQDTDYQNFKNNYEKDYQNTNIENNNQNNNSNLFFMVSLQLSLADIDFSSKYSNTFHEVSLNFYDNILTNDRNNLLYEISNFPIDNSYQYLYNFPLTLCDFISSLDYVTLIISTNLNSTLTLRHCETRLELLSLPSKETEVIPRLLNNFEYEANKIVGNFLDNLLEDVRETEANGLIKIEKDINYKESLLKNLREDIERERRGQEINLRELRTASREQEMQRVQNVNRKR